jgi:hypothetical protein
MVKNDPVITYDHMNEEPLKSEKYFRKDSANNYQVVLFFAEEMFILGMLSALIYLVFI